MVNLLMEEKKDKEQWNGQRKNIIKELLVMIYLRDMEFINGKMVINMKVYGNKVKGME